MRQENTEECKEHELPQVYYHKAHSVSVMGKISEDMLQNNINEEEISESAHMNPIIMPIISPSKQGRRPVNPIKVRVLEILRAELRTDAPIDSVELAYSSVPWINS